MFDYYSDIIWAVNAALFGTVVVTAIVIVFSAAFKDHIWNRRLAGLLEIKKDVYETVLAGKGHSEAVCQSFFNGITPQQFLDIAMNRNMDTAFFNDSEQQLLRSCFTTSEQIAKLSKAAGNSINKWRGIEAMLCLGYTQVESAIDILRGKLLSKDEDIAYFSMVSLGQIKTVRSAQALLSFLKKYPSSGYRVASILEGFPKEIAEDVIRLTDSRNASIRFRALTILSKFAPKGHIDKLEKLTYDMNAEVRAAACDCLGNIGSDAAKQTLLKRIKDDSWLVKRHAVFALEKIMGDKVLPEVVNLINDASWSVADAIKDVMMDHIEASLPYIEKFVTGKDCVPKKYAIMVLKNSLESLDPSTKARITEILSKIDSGS
ncbi:MAG: HEAT repeat domain-containing protein [Candidatus Omnitrophota bacterium]|nr:HEAT repeat domain-containing protein [Candidatus Omnitrophota bacterium]